MKSTPPAYALLKPGCLSVELPETQRTRLPHALLYPALFVGSITQASAAVIVVSDDPMTIGEGDSVAWDINQDSSPDTTINDEGFSINRYDLCFDNDVKFMTNGAQLITAISTAMTVSSSDTFEELGCEARLKAGTNFDYTDFNEFSPNTSSFTGIMGFKFDNSGSPLYGILEFTATNCDNSEPHNCSVTISQWAYEDTGASISGNALTPPVSASVESVLGTSLLGLALGAAGLRQRRRQSFNKTDAR